MNDEEIQSIKKYRRNYFHTVEIVSRLYKGPDESPDVVVSNVPEEFVLAFGNEWNPAYGKGIAGNVLGGVSKILNKSGKTVTSPVMTALGWSGSSTPSYNLTLIFDAKEDPITDVVNPLRALIKMTVPKLRSNGFVADIPGPSSIQFMIQQLRAGISRMQGQPATGEENKIDNTISLRIGTLFYSPSVVIESLRLQASTKVNRVGEPIHAKVDVTFRPFVAPFYDDVIHQLFPMSGKITDYKWEL